MRKLFMMFICLLALSGIVMALDDITGKPIASEGPQAVGYQESLPVDNTDPALPEFSAFGIGAVAGLAGVGYYFVRRKK